MDSSAIDLDGLEAFAAFAAHRNFTHAAAAINLSQPALHARIRKLEQALGVALYSKHGRRLELTAAGRRALAFSRDMLARRTNFCEQVQGRTEHVVTLAAGEGAVLYLLADAIRRFHRRKQRRLRVLTRNAADTLTAVVTAEADVGVAPLFSSPPDGIATRRLISVGMQIVVPKGHVFAKRSRVAIADLDGAPLVVPPQGTLLRHDIEQALRRAGHHANVAVEASGWQLMMHFVGLGLGVAITNAHCRPPRGTVAVALSGLAPIDYHVVFRKGTEDGAVAEFIAAFESPPKEKPR